MTVPENPQVVHVELGSRSYDVRIRPGSLSQIAAILTVWRNNAAGGVALIVSDTNLADSYGRAVHGTLTEAGWRTELQTLPAGEVSKSFETLATIYDALVALRADRQAVVVAVGGGVIGDAAGFAAATYNRGLPFVQIPTSLLAMVDSSVGGKVGVNHPQGKNLIGAFHQPLGVLIDPSVLSTLPDRDYRGGLAEVIKYGVILDADFFTFLEENIDAIGRRDPAVLATIIARSCRLKADVVEQDEFERSGLRAVLNYGHTFGHAFEALAGYGTLSHGEAVAIGMHCASRLAERRGLVDSDFTQRQQKLITALGLPTSLPTGVEFPTANVLARMRLDKKNAGGKLRFILPVRLGEVRLFDDISEEDVAAAVMAQLEWPANHAN
ncbi:MAG: 3-dehydroquinate synthase [Planctomycetota bacterium]|nr:3-dehydroquinate synthase [Planctomycetaceae bacterium]MDQ3331724.1 3-dehydroquinate synthase [Planctomycetota bacterium]